MYAYVAYRIGAGPDAEDVTSETFARALRYRKSYDATKGTPAAWLTGIARRVIAEAAAAKRPDVHDMPDTAAPGRFEDDSVTKVTVDRAVARLESVTASSWHCATAPTSRPHRSVRYSSLSPNAVEVALHRALRRLRDELEGSRTVRRAGVPEINGAPDAV